MENRIAYTEGGKLDEIVADGGVHIERLGKKRWFIACVRKDGSETAIWMHKGKVTLMEERPAPKRGPIAAAGFGRMIVCPKCGNKRCPHAVDPKYKCTNSNEPGQFGFEE